MVKSMKTLGDITSDELKEILDDAVSLKSRLKEGKKLDILKGKTVALLFEKPSTRTRASFESAIFKLGGSPVYLPSGDLQMKRGEPVKDVARMFGSYFDCIVSRVYSHNTILELAEYSGVPIINALCDRAHPTQAVCDALTILEVKGGFEGRKLAYIGDGNNVCHSLLMMCSMLKMDISVACPKSYEPNDKIVTSATKIANSNGCKVDIMEKPADAADSADILYADTWVSMGEEDKKAQKIEIFRNYQINEELLNLAKPDASVMHCLPAYRGYEITEDILEGPRCIAWQQGENKMYAAAGVLKFFMEH